MAWGRGVCGTRPANSHQLLPHHHHPLSVMNVFNGSTFALLPSVLVSLEYRCFSASNHTHQQNSIIINTHFQSIYLWLIVL